MQQKVNKKKGKREIKRKEVRKPEKKRKPDNKKGQERKRSEVCSLKAIKHKKEKFNIKIIPEITKRTRKRKKKYKNTTKSANIYIIIQRYQEI